MSLVLAVLYVWSQLNRDQIVSFFFGLKFKARPSMQRAPRPTPRVLMHSGGGGGCRG